MPRIVIALLLLTAVLVGRPASAAPPLPAPGGQQGIGPGVQMFTVGAQCTGNFVFRDRRHRLYVGYAAHCAGTGAATDTDGCTTKSLPRGTRVRFAVGASEVDDGTEVGQGTLAYSSWLTMRRVGTTDADTCAANDLALVRVDRADRDLVDPTVPHWGGPTGLATKGAPEGSSVYSWGQSSLRPDQTLSPRQGVSLGSANGGWGWDVYTVTPGVPGDSGSGFLDAEGRALGVLSTVAVAPLPLSNGVGDLAHELAFARAHSGIRGLRLVRGTVPFAP
jgi:hypothetical protein